jgi:gamma-glutamyltranspeptidase/glutathione hydrolase
VAVSAALMVVWPSGSGFLGGGMYLLHRAKDGQRGHRCARSGADEASRDMFMIRPAIPSVVVDQHRAGGGYSSEPAGLALMQSRADA